ncbi:MAG: BadF/BadG/BcrA/BcrD ATPase family protein [Gemmobacter sp.]
MRFVGVDGGGSGCRGAVCDAAGNVLAQADGGPANIDTDPDGAARRLSDLLARLCGAGPAPARIVLGLAGANAPGRSEALTDRLAHPGLVVVSDVATAVAGAIGSADGIVCALGTGSVFARQSGGGLRVIGGWGFRLGDEASGAWIGRQAVALALRAADGFVPASPLLTALLDECGGPPGAMRRWSEATPAEFAALVPRIVAAQAGADPAAARIIAAARDEIEAAIRLLQPADRTLPVTLTGGLAPVFAPMLMASGWTLRRPAGSPLDGALALARRGVA